MKISAAFFIILLTIPFNTLYSNNDNLTTSYNHSYNASFLYSTSIRASFQIFSTSMYNNDNEYCVVLDAGHGGHDHGCTGKISKEKDIALQIALLTGQTLQMQVPGIKIIYTRKEDRFVPLRERIQIANDHKADIFISIHCNYADNSKVCGTETFVMGLHKAPENLNVAKRENSSILLEEDFESKYEGYSPNSPLGHILLSTYQNLHLNNSIALADKIEKSFEHRHKFNSRGVKQAGFVVLRKATMPSILIEAGFLSNLQEERYLTSRSGQQEIASSIGQSLKTYFEKIDNLHRTNIETVKKYTIQLGVFSNNDKRELFEYLRIDEDVVIIQEGILFRYTLGSYETKNHAKKVLEQIRNQGVKEAFIKEI